MASEDTAVLIEIRDLLREIRERIVPVAAPGIRSPYAPARGKVNLMPQPLLPHREQIAAWRSEGLSGVEMTRRLQAAGVKTSTSAVSRFLRGYLMPDQCQ